MNLIKSIYSFPLGLFDVYLFIFNCYFFIYLSLSLFNCPCNQNFNQIAIHYKLKKAFNMEVKAYLNNKKRVLVKNIIIPLMIILTNKNH